MFEAAHACVIATDVSCCGSTTNLTTALLQRPAHQAERAMTVASDKTCVFTQVVIPCPYGELVAKAAIPRVFLVSSCAAQLSNDEVALLSVLMPLCRTSQGRANRLVTACCISSAFSHAMQLLSKSASSAKTAN